MRSKVMKVLVKSCKNATEPHGWAINPIKNAGILLECILNSWNLNYLIQYSSLCDEDKPL